MREEQNKSTISFDKAPSPSPGFETELIQEVEGLVEALPVGAVRLHIGRIPGLPDCPEPYFEVIPRNPKAARFSGAPIVRDLNLAVGKGDWREFYGFARGGTVVRGAMWQEELRWIWLATVAGGFSSRLYLDSLGKIIGWWTKLTVNGSEVIFRNGRRSERLFGRERIETVTYEPYL